MTSDLETLAKLLAPEPTIRGVTAADGAPEPRESFERAVRYSRKVKATYDKKRSQSVNFERGPVCIVNIADIHAGASGVDYDWLRADLELITSTPGMWIGLAGDLVDNYIVGRLALLNMLRDFTITEEWAIAKHIAQMVAPRLLWLVGGNHDKWTYAVSGLDYLREVYEALRPDVLYDQDDMRVTVQVGARSYRWRIRHKWRGTSIYNPTHGIERAAKFGAGGFDVGIGAHTHASGVARYFNDGGKTALAVLCGSYKRIDKFARQEGFPVPNDVTAVPVVLSETGIMTFSNLQAAAEYMRRCYDG